MGSVNPLCERRVELNETIKVKNCIYYDPKGRLKGMAGSTVFVDNPHHHKTDPYNLSVRDRNQFYITTVVPREGQKPGRKFTIAPREG